MLPLLTFSRFVPDETDSYNTFLERARTQKIVILEHVSGCEQNCHANDEACPYNDVKIAGPTGNFYKVIISPLSTCSCPNRNFEKGGAAVCNHIMYVLHLVLKALEHLCYQDAFLTSELHDIDANAPALPAAAIEVDAMDGKRKAIEHDCPICFMEF